MFTWAYFWDSHGSFRWFPMKMIPNTRIALNRLFWLIRKFKIVFDRIRHISNSFEEKIVHCREIIATFWDVTFITEISFYQFQAKIHQKHPKRLKSLFFLQFDLQNSFQQIFPVSCIYQKNCFRPFRRFLLIMLQNHRIAMSYPIWIVWSSKHFSTGKLLHTRLRRKKSSRVILSLFLR